MKKLLLLTAFIGFSFAISAQSLVLEHEGVELEDGATIMIIGDPTSGMNLVADLKITNNATKSLNILAKKVIEEGDTLTGTLNYFCWGQCFGPEVYVSPTAIPVAPGVHPDPFLADYLPNFIPGISTVKYELYDESNVEDVVSVIVQFNASPAAVNEFEEFEFSDAYPNPANDFITFDYDLPAGMNQAQVVIFNLLGSRIMEVPVNSGQGSLKINTFDLQEGLYFYTVYAGSEAMATKKFIVKH